MPISFPTTFWSGFSPISLSPVLWLSGRYPETAFQDAALTIPAASDGDRVGGRKDKSTALRHVTQSVESKRATLKTGVNGQNLKPGDLYDGFDDFLVYTTSGLGLGSGNFTIYTVFKNVTNANIRVILSDYNSTTSLAGEIWHSVGDSLANVLLYVRRTSAGSNNMRAATCTTVLANNTPYIATCVWDGDFSVRINGAAEASVNTNSVSSITGPRGIFVGAINNGNLPFNSNIYEIVVFPAAHSGSQIAQMESYLNTEWAVY